MWESRSKHVKSKYSDADYRGKYNISLVGTDIVFKTIKSAELFTGLPSVCIKDSAENGNQYFGYQFEYVTDNSGRFIYIDITNFMEYGKTSKDIQEFRNKLLNNL